MTSIGSSAQPTHRIEATAPGALARECAHTEFTRRERVVCRSQDRVESVQVSDEPALWQDLCHEHQIPYKYETGLEKAEEDCILDALPPGDPRVQEIRRLRREARYARVRWAMDRRRVRLLQEERRLREEADRLLDDVLAELASEGP